MKKITILTRPVPRNALERTVFFLKKRTNVLRRYVGTALKGKRLIRDMLAPAYGGHFAVTRSLIEGLDDLSVNYVLDPTSLKEVTPIVLDLSSVPALTQGIYLKKKGLIQTFIVGPNLMNLSSDHGGILADPNIDAIIVPSEWTKELYVTDLPSIKNKIEIWPAGVDEAYWQPQSNDRAIKKEILIYWKHSDTSLLEHIKKIIEKNGYEVSLITYGSYSKKEYREALEKSAGMIFVSHSESEGIAPIEAWSMNVPTFCFLPETVLMAPNKIVPNFSTCPYLSETTGAFWKNVSELEKHLSTLSEKTGPAYHPRQWVLDHLTDTLSAKLLLDVIEKYNA